MLGPDSSSLYLEDKSATFAFNRLNFQNLCELYGFGRWGLLSIIFFLSEGEKRKGHGDI